MEHWLKSQLSEAHTVLDAMGVPKSVRKPDPQAPYQDKDFSLGIAERINWLRQHWQPKTTPSATGREPDGEGA